MTISSVSGWDASTEANNTDLNDIPLGENLTKGPHVNGLIRELMKQAKAGFALKGANTDITSVYLDNTGLKIKDTNASHGLSIVPGSNITADRTLTLTTGDASRTITINGNPTLDDWFDQAVKQASSPTFAGVLTGAGSAGTPGLRFSGDTNTGIYSHAADQIGIATGGTYRVTITNTILGVACDTAFSLGTNDVLNGAYIEGAGRLVASATSDSSLGLRRLTDNGTLATFFRGITNVGTISVTTTNTAYNTSSDERLKKFIGKFDPKKAIEIIRADPVRDFNWIEEYGGEYAVGWGAQTSYKVSPDLASPGSGRRGSKDFVPWGVDQGKRTPYLWAAMSDVLDRLEALEAAQ